uniref:Uncharacterized protein n=1 Tax=viral metagenome TaxID=1070528 RepID=A0A6C0CAQ2_9ZZZZ
MSTNKNRCTTCLNYKEVTCGFCSRGQNNCIRCNGKGYNVEFIREKNGASYVNKSIQRKCISCSGGKKTCNRCHGRGKVRCEKC